MSVDLTRIKPVSRVEVGTGSQNEKNTKPDNEALLSKQKPDKSVFFSAGFNRFSERKPLKPDGELKRLQVIKQNGMSGSKTC